MAESTPAVLTVTVATADGVNLPTSTPDASLPAHWNGTADETPADMAALQALFTAGVAAGTIIELDSGTTYTGRLTIGPANKGTLGNEIIIRTSDYASLPAFGTRISEAQESLLATISSTGSDSPGRRALQVFSSTDQSGGAAYIRFIGINFTTSDTTVTNSMANLVTIGYQDESATRPTDSNDFPTHIMFNHCCIKGQPTSHIGDAFMPEGKHIAFVDGRIREIHASAAASNGDDGGSCVRAYNSPGPLLIHNNFLSASGIDVMFGDSGSHTFRPSDITITKNHFWRDPALEGDATFVQKNRHESKNSERVLIEGNVFENGWYAAQQCTSFYPKSAGIGGQTLHQTFRNNITFNSHFCFRIAGLFSDATENPELIRIDNNLFYDMDGVGQLVGDNASVFIRNNTFISNGTSQLNPQLGTTTGSSDITIRDNIFDSGIYNFKQDGAGEGINSLDAHCSGDYEMTYNAFRGVTIGSFNGTAQAGSTAANNYAPALSLDIGYADPDNSDYSLDSGSTYYTASSTGGQLGCDFTALLAATAGVRDAAVNLPPVLTIQAGMTFVEGDGATALDAASTITDYDGTTLVSGSIVGGGILDGASEVLVIGVTSYPLNANKTATGTGGGTTFSIAYTTATQTFVITKSGGGTFPRADYQTLMRGITYDNAASPVTEGDRTFDFTVNDGIDDSNTDRITVTVAQPVGTTWPDDWDGYDTPSALAAPSGTLTDFTYLISLDQMSATWWSTVKSDGGDIRASKSDGTTQLAVDLIEWNYGSQTGLLAVKYSGNQTATPDDILIWCGNVSASQPAATDTYGSDNAYASSRLAFYPSGGGNDRTSHSNDLTMSGAPTVGGASGPIDGSFATDYNGSDQYGIASASVPTAAPLTIVACGNSDSNSVTQAAAAVCDSTDSGNDYFRLSFSGSVASDPVQFQTRRNGSATATTSTGFTAATWQHAAGVEVSSTDRNAYIDGGSVGNDTTSQVPTTIDRITVGAMVNTVQLNLFNGRLSFVSIHNVALSADWIAYEAAMLDGADPDQSDFFGTWSWTAS